MRKENFQSLLRNYFDEARLNIADGLLSVLFPEFVLKKNASKLMASFAQRRVPDGSEPKHTVSIPPYEGSNKHVIAMISLLENKKEDLLAAVVHGSLATGEEINYSDFDGLLIIKDEVFLDKDRLVSLAKVIHESRRIMHLIDPLQHHGWFVLTESDLKDFPSAYLPLEVLAYACSLIPVSGTDLRVVIKTKPDFYAPVKNMCRRIRKVSKSGNRPKTLYQLKSILSEFMMLPTLYIQARDQRGVFKKFSFIAAAADFNQSTWSIMDEVSKIRMEWPEFESQIELEKFRKIGYIWMKYRKKQGPAIPGSLAKKLNDDFYCRMAELANQIEVNLFR